MTEELYTPIEVAKRLKVTRRTVYTWLKDGHLQAKKAGKGWRVSEASLNELASSSGKIYPRGAKSIPENPMMRALALADELRPVIQSGTHGTTDAAQSLREMREERDEEIARV